MKKQIWIALAASLVLSCPAYAESEGHGSGEADEHQLHWGYTGEAGPEHWGSLDEAYHTCKEGMSQSPIDISTAPHQDATALVMDYKGVPLSIINNGHTIQVNYASGSTLTVDGKTYHLAQFHFHSPSEHTYKANPYPMEAHLVHKADDGSLAVVGVLIKEGKENPFLANIWSHLPHEVNQLMFVSDKTINVADFLPGDKAFWNYSGSLTTPPCSEGVKWFVMDKSVEASHAQVQEFLNLIGENARPVQPINDRSVVHRM